MSSVGWWGSWSRSASGTCSRGPAGLDFTIGTFLLALGSAVALLAVLLAVRSAVEGAIRAAVLVRPAEGEGGLH